MNFVKKNIKWIIVIIVSIIIASSITVYATSYLAKDITYKDGKNVEQALNELYGRKHIETGSINITFSHSWVYQTIEFENEYTNIPEIYYGYNAGNSGGSVYVTDITTTSFKIGYNSFFNTLNSDTIKWFAVGQ